MYMPLRVNSTVYTVDQIHFGPQSRGLEVYMTDFNIFSTLSFVQDASRNSVCHTATVIANSYMHCGTTSDTFLR